MPGLTIIPGPMHAQWRAGALVGLLVFGACMLGIVTRPVGFLAAFWPANALALGLMTRFPRLSVAGGWVGAALGYMAADLLTGGQWLAVLWLTAANMSTVATGALLFRRLRRSDLALRHPMSVLRLFFVCVAAAGVATLLGAWANPLFFGRPLVDGIAYWFSAELVNCIIVLPVILTLPDRPPAWPGLAALRPRRLLPALGVGCSVGAAFLIGGPGAIAFPVPALIWCALSYGIFGTAILTMGTTGLMLVAVSAGWLPDLQTISFLHETLSMRTGVTLLALAPLTVASINTAQNDLLRQLDHAASHDALTGCLNRAATLAAGAALISRAPPLAVLLIDIDHFKQVNDGHGHAAGDAVLACFGREITAQLRQGDLLGRLGGEEFAVLLPATGASDALAIAERLRRHVEGLAIAVAHGTLQITISAGVATAGPENAAALADLLRDADKALYRAKGDGRNRVAAA
ncbi:GGDEF domain-containing protein [Zavarzinia compransoris]|uniref:diguanylate cyclase n=1 Tax=Zavarzinia compransoris TaxID=1264899 RepID=A0A317DVZ6_9PROT|nr:GGDEF domain-containing protein [Zavarzinia compransoris]PWR18859.1 sensor domain-containing diguanylate cyclase [Zavarzinia compransoris]TDP48852.1 diguanylate cyclase (GGDEF)-like protein [Zavarzinia compransoris]